MIHSTGNRVILQTSLTRTQSRRQRVCRSSDGRVIRKTCVRFMSRTPTPLPSCFSSLSPFHILGFRSYSSSHRLGQVNLCLGLYVLPLFLCRNLPMSYFYDPRDFRLIPRRPLRSCRFVSSDIVFSQCPLSWGDIFFVQGRTTNPGRPLPPVLRGSHSPLFVSTDTFRRDRITKGLYSLQTRQVPGVGRFSLDVFCLRLWGYGLPILEGGWVVRSEVVKNVPVNFERIPTPESFMSTWSRSRLTIIRVIYVQLT